MFWRPAFKRALQSTHIAIVLGTATGSANCHELEVWVIVDSVGFRGDWLVSMESRSSASVSLWSQHLGLAGTRVVCKPRWGGTMQQRLFKAGKSALAYISHSPSLESVCQIHRCITAFFYHNDTIITGDCFLVACIHMHDYVHDKLFGTNDSVHSFATSALSYSSAGSLMFGLHLWGYFVPYCVVIYLDFGVPAGMADMRCS